MSIAITPLPAPSPDRLNDVVLANITAELGRRRLSARRAAALVGMSQQAVSDRLNGRTRLNLDDVQRFAELFGMDPTELLVRHQGLEPRTR
ncbi:helix-turn-helix domain-containing protein [Actinotalea lenta]|uniref:helix-turn-helix domain-containing protein n=1 Tax=Actinotalea lenta TaxID=3064654 RepID=UPI0033130364